MNFFIALLIFLSPTILLAQHKYTLPIYPDCPYSENNEELRECFLSNFSSVLKSNIDAEILTIIRNENIQHLNIYFSVDENGKLVNFKTPSYSNSTVSRYFSNKFKEMSDKLTVKPATINGVASKIELNTRLVF